MSEHITAQSAAMLRRAAERLRWSADKLEARAVQIEGGKNISDVMMDAANCVAQTVPGVQIELFVKYAALAAKSEDMA